MAKKDFNVIPDHKDFVPIVKRKKYNQALAQGNYSAAIKSLADVLEFFEGTHFVSYCPQDRLRIDEFVAAVFNVITDPGLVVDEKEAIRLAACGHLFANVVATSSYGTTDGPLVHVLRQDNNFSKLLFLCNARNTLQLDPVVFFNVDTKLATVWYNTYTLTTSNPTEIMQRNLLQHLKRMDERWDAPSPQISVLYFCTTYLAPGEDRRVKGIINKSCKSKLNVNVKNTPNPKKIAIVTAKWRRNHAVYKSASPLVDQLKGKYDLTLIHLGKTDPVDLVTEGFDRVGHVKFDGVNLTLPNDVQDNDYAAVYYPDIGMNDESVWLSNCRLAPIQVMGYGHPATSGDNSAIDYFIGGHVEKDASNNYAEQMVLIPGLAQSPVWPSYERKNNWEPNKEVQINCVWGPDKYNYTMLRILKTISDTAKAPHRWNFFPSPGINRYAGLVPFVADIASVLPNSRVVTDKEYYEYMEEAEKGDFSVNSFPFGGYNTVIESLYLGLPVLTVEGDRFYNRAASHLLRSIGMGDLSHEEFWSFVDHCVELIDDPNSLIDQRARLANVDLRAVLFNDTSTHFLEAFEYIFNNHPIVSDKPVLIGV